MVKHRFGGSWTDDKLTRIRKYLAAYTTIFQSNERARHFRTTYLDAFAGTGTRTDSAPSDDALDGSLFDVAADADAESLKKGSARIALEVEPQFDRYIFVEQNAKRVAELESLDKKFPGRDIRVERAEANSFIRAWCAETDWKRNRAVVFLDPYGMQVDWTTVEAIASTKAIDVWWLFPLGVAVSRLLKKKQLPPARFAQALTRIFGTEKWKSAFYHSSEEATLFGPETTIKKTADFEELGSFVVGRLRSVFAGVASNPLELRNSKDVPIYLLCFAAGNKKGAPTAVEIAEHVLKA